MEVRFTSKPAKICGEGKRCLQTKKWEVSIQFDFDIFVAAVTIMKTQAMVMKMLAMATTVWSAEMAKAMEVAV